MEASILLLDVMLVTNDMMGIHYVYIDKHKLKHNYVPLILLNI